MADPNTSQLDNKMMPRVTVEPQIEFDINRSNRIIIGVRKHSLILYRFGSDSLSVFSKVLAKSRRGNAAWIVLSRFAGEEFAIGAHFVGGRINSIGDVVESGK